MTPPLRSALVYKGKHPAARIDKYPDRTEFRYLAPYLASDLPAVATTLPKRDQIVTTYAGAIPPFFAGLLPEGHRLSVLQRSLKASADDELTLLLAIGADTVGDVRALPLTDDATDEVLVARNQPFSPHPMAELTRDPSEISFHELRTEDLPDPAGIAGVQRKASGSMINLPGALGQRQVIVKLDPPGYPHLTRNEAAMLGLARQVGFTVPDWQLVTDRDGVDALIITRFDRAPAPLPVEDAAQILGLWPADKYNVSSEQVTVALADLTFAPAVTRLELFRRFCFALITGNGDLHAKNLSIIRGVSGRWRLSPFYDLPSTLLYGDQSMALTLQNRTENVSRRRLLEFADAIDLPQRAAQRHLALLLKATAPALSDVQSLGLPFAPNTLREWQQQLNYRRRLLS